MEPLSNENNRLTETHLPISIEHSTNYKFIELKVTDLRGLLREKNTGTCFSRSCNFLDQNPVKCWDQTFCHGYCWRFCFSAVRGRREEKRDGWNWDFIYAEIWVEGSSLRVLKSFFWYWALSCGPILLSIC